MIRREREREREKHTYTLTDTVRERNWKKMVNINGGEKQYDKVKISADMGGLSHLSLLL